MEKKIRNHKKTALISTTLLVIIIAYILALGYIKREARYKVFSVLSLPPLFQNLYSNSIFILEDKTKTVMVSKNADSLTPPASLTKMMSLYLAYEKIHTGAIHLTDIVPVSLNAWAKMLPTDASRMFLEPGQKPTLLDIMRGLAIPSGNDAAIALAEYISGNVKDFVDLMNRTVKSLGFNHMHFEDPNGLSNSNYITAKEFALFCRFYVDKFPESINEIHIIPELLYPRKDNLPAEYLGRRMTIYQPNKNPLLGHLEGVEGLKTGYLDKSGFNIAISVKRDNLRFIAVILGSFASTGKQANKNRVSDATNLINYLYDTYHLEENLFKQTYSIPKYKITLSVPQKYQKMLMLNGKVIVKAELTYLNPFYYHKNDIVGVLKLKDYLQREATVPLMVNQEHLPQTLLEKIKAFLFALFPIF
jgi:D-alanyl-D-alanine carboxypeptidase